jgi:hypothetical protein
MKHHLSIPLNLIIVMQFTCHLHRDRSIVQVLQFFFTFSKYPFQEQSYQSLTELTIVIVFALQLFSLSNVS